MTPIETVQHIYAAFGRGDIPAILACLADDVDWEHDTFPNPIPWLQHGRGHAAVQTFFGILAEQIEFRRFTPTHVLADGDLVVALTDVEFSVRATGKSVVEIDEVHLWRFNSQGKVQRFRHRIDSWQCAMALRGSD